MLQRKYWKKQLSIEDGREVKSFTKKTTFYKNQQWAVLRCTFCKED